MKRQTRRPAGSPRGNAPRYYFAYGSNLHVAQMQRRCPGAQPVGTLLLLDWELVFRRVADVIPSTGKFVRGAIYTITPEDEDNLDRYEGYHVRNPLRGLYRKETFRFVLDGTVQEAMLYVMNRGGEERPSDSYYETIEAGYDAWGLDRDTLEAARERAERFETEWEIGYALR